VISSCLLTEEETRRAEKHLRRRDPVMRGLIATHGPYELHRLQFKPFHTLARSVISQQLSAKAADTIEGRVRQALGGSIGPKRCLSADIETLRSAGLSGAKATCLMELARRVDSGQLNFRSMLRMDEDELILMLTDIPGIGRWTAEMFLIFGLRSPNVLAVGDAGLRRAAKMLYGRDALEQYRADWEPYCSVASWYLWRHLDS
jgi:DNA-3-methyladenine glycosylase II